jgi:plastocyanin
VTADSVIFDRGGPLVRGLLAAIALTVILAACGSSTHSGGSGGSTPSNLGATVELKNVAFNPPTVTIKSGQSVLWKFDDGSIAHDVTGDGFRSNDMTSGTYSHKFTTPGTYHYQCTIHSDMTGEVVVTP